MANPVLLAGLDVGPRLPMDDVVDRILANAELSSERRLLLSCLDSPPYLKDGGISEAGLMVPLAAHGDVVRDAALPTWRSPLRRHVTQVFGPCAEPEVPRIAARRVVARVADIRGLIERAVDQHVGDTARGMRPALKTELPVPTSSARCEPYPAFIGAARAVDLRPETLFERARLAYRLMLKRAAVSKESLVVGTTQTVRSCWLVATRGGAVLLHEYSVSLNGHTVG